MNSNDFTHTTDVISLGWTTPYRKSGYGLTEER
jgi:hypothetical protein